MADHSYPVTIQMIPATEERNRLTTAFRFFLALPHLILVGGPAAFGGWFGWHAGADWSWSSGTGLVGIVVCLATVVAWFAIVITGSHPGGLRQLTVYYLRWRVRAISYMTLLRDEYPPFGDGDYPAALVLDDAPGSRNRLTVFFRVFLALPHFIALAVLGALWAFTTALAWVMILLTGRFPETLYGFALGVLAWTTRVEAYVLLLCDEYPPFTLRV